jgi:hypothetical protein
MTTGVEQTARSIQDLVIVHVRTLLAQRDVVGLYQDTAYHVFFTLIENPMGHAPVMKPGLEKETAPCILVLVKDAAQNVSALLMTIA